MAVSLVSRSCLLKDVLSSTLRINAVFKPYASYPPESVKRWDEIPGPKTLPIIGNLWDYYQGKYTLHDLPRIYEGYFETYGPLVKEYVYYGKTVVHVFKPEDMASIYRLDVIEYPYRESHRALEKYRRKMGYRNGGLPSCNGKTWAQLRKLLKEDELLKPHHSDAFEIVAQDFVNKIYNLITFKPSRQLDLFPWLYYWALECMTVFTLGQSSQVFTGKVDYDWVQQFIICLGDSEEITFYTENLPWMFTRGMRKRLHDCQEFMYMFLMRRMSYPVYQAYLFEKNVPPDIVVEGATISLNNSMAHDMVKRHLDDRDIRTFIIDMFQGGLLSSAHVLAFALYYLAKHPKEQMKVRRAIKDQLMEKDGNKGGFKTVCQEINSVLLETMRLNPPTMGTGRVLPQPVIMSNYLVPPGARCILHHQIASKNEAYFKNPDKFMPDRFSVPLKAESLVANSPFALGKRQCPGQLVAMNMLGITLRTILKNFELAYDYDPVGTRSGLINVPDKQITMTFKPSPMT